MYHLIEDLKKQAVNLASAGYGFYLASNLQVRLPLDTSEFLMLLAPVATVAIATPIFQRLKEPKRDEHGKRLDQIFSEMGFPSKPRGHYFDPAFREVIEALGSVAYGFLAHEGVIRLMSKAAE